MGLLFISIAILFAATVLAIGYYENYKRKGYNMPEESKATTSTSSGHNISVVFHPPYAHIAIVQKNGRKMIFVNGKKVIRKNDYTLDFWSQDPAFQRFANDTPLPGYKWTSNFTPPTEPYNSEECKTRKEK